MNRKIALRSPSQNIPPESRSSERESSSSIILSPFYPQTALPSAALSANYTRDIQNQDILPILKTTVPKQTQYTGTTYRSNPPVASVTRFKDTTTTGGGHAVSEALH
jgi:hypothetical protein